MIRNENDTLVSNQMHKMKTIAVLLTLMVIAAVATQYFAARYDAWYAKQRAEAKERNYPSKPAFIYATPSTPSRYGYAWADVDGFSILEVWGFDPEQAVDPNKLVIHAIYEPLVTQEQDGSWTIKLNTERRR